MMPNDFKARLARGEKLFGTMITLPTPTTAEILAGVGFDWFFIDGEHGPLGTREVLAILQAVSHRVACIVRVPEAAEVPIKQMLDIGAHGIIVPQVNSAQTAADVVRWAKYSPAGSRGVGLARAHGYGAGFAQYIQRANDEIAVIVQAEHAQAVENIEAIAAINGIDAIQLGPYDLSASMGKLGQITDPEVVAAITRIYSVCRTSEGPRWQFRRHGRCRASRYPAGATMICAGTDSLFLGQAASNMLATIKPVP